MLSVSIKKLRENAGLTQQQVADLLNVDRSTYAYYEIGKTTPSITSLKKLAKIFNVSYDVLIDGASKYVLSDNSIQYRTVDYSNDMIYSLSRNEKKLVLLFRLYCEESQREILQKLADGLKKQDEDTLS